MRPAARVCTAALATLVVAAPTLAPAEDRTERGRAVYETRCYYCHGYAGDARTAAADVLRPRPRDFTTLVPGELSAERMLAAVRDGRPGTAMPAFATLLDEQELHDVVDYIAGRFVGGGRVDARYHSVTNGWAGDPHGSPAAPWVLGRRDPSAPWESLSEVERESRRLYLDTCISCHVPVERDGAVPAWRNLAVSYPVGNYVELPHGQDGDAPPDGEPTAVFERHEPAPPVPPGDTLAAEGQAVYQRACAACHAGNGSGRNWVGSFIDPPPPDLRDPGVASVHDRGALLRLVRDGVPGTAMPAFRGVLTDAQQQALAHYFSRLMRPLAD